MRLGAQERVETKKMAGVVAKEETVFVEKEGRERRERETAEKGKATTKRERIQPGVGGAGGTPNGVAAGRVTAPSHAISRVPPASPRRCPSMTRWGHRRCGGGVSTIV